MFSDNLKVDTTRRSARLTQISRGLGLLIICLGLIVMAGWLLNIPILTRFHPAFTTMKFNTAVLFVLSGIAIFRFSPNSRYLQIIAWVILLIAGLTLSQHLFGWNSGIDQLLITDTQSAAYPGRMSGISAINFIFASCSLLSMSRRPRLSQFFAFLVGFFTLIALAGYVYRVPQLYQLFQFAILSFHTATVFFLLSVALLLTNRNSQFMRIMVSDSAGAQLIGQVLPTTILLLIIIDTLFILGEKLGLYPAELLLPLSVVSSIAAVVIVIYSMADRWHETDLRRIVAEEQIRQSYGLLEMLVQERTEALGLYKAAVEASSEQIIIVDDAYRLIAVNDAYLRYRPNPREAIIGKPMRDNVGTDYFDTQLKPLFERALAGETLNFEISVQYPLLGLRHMLANYSPVRDSANRVVAVVAVIHDITERKRIENALRENEQKLQALFDVLPVGVALFDSKRQIIQMNPMLEQILGLSLPEANAEDHPHHRYIHPDGTPLQAGEFPSERVIHEQQPIFDMEIGIVKESNKTVWTSVNAAPLSIAGVSAVVVTQDITHRKQIEHALEASMEYLSMLTHALADGILTVNLKTRTIQFVNQRYCDIFGYTQEELIGQSTRIIYEDDEQFLAFGQALQEAINSGNLPLITERQLLRKNGERIWTSTATSTLTLDGQVTEAISIVRDITERKRAELQARQLEYEREKVKILHDFITNASHDLKTPITQMITSLYLLKRTLTNDDQQNRIQKLEAHTARLRTIVEALVQMTELDAHESFIFGQVNIKVILDDLMIAFKPLAERKQQQLTMHCPMDTILVEGDAQYLHLALRRIIDNALNFTPEGGSITILVYRKAADYVIEIKDTGIGIDTVDLPHIFERFYRADKARAIGEGHTGMGLAIAHKIIGDHHGRIEVTSRLDEGSSFCIILPAADDEVTEQTSD